MNERKSVNIEQLQSRREKITSVVDKLSQFPGIGSETVVDRQLSGLSGSEWMNKLVAISEPGEILDQLKGKIESKTIPALANISEAINVQVEVHQKSAENYQKIKDLVAAGRLPSKYLEELEKEFDGATSVVTESASVEIAPESQETQQTQPETVIQQDLQQEPEQSTVEEKNDEEQEVINFDFTTIDGIEISLDKGFIVRGEYKITLDEFERKILEQLYKNSGEWVTTQSLVNDAAAGARWRFNQKLGSLREKLVEDSYNPKLIISSGFGPKGGNYRFGLENLQGYEPKADETIENVQELQSSGQQQDEPEVSSTPQATPDLQASEPVEEPEKDSPSLILPNGVAFASGKVQMQTLAPLLQNMEEGLTYDEWTMLAYGVSNQDSKARLIGNLQPVKKKLQDLGYVIERRSLGGVFRFNLVEQQTSSGPVSVPEPQVEVPEPQVEVPEDVQVQNAEVFAEPEEEVEVSQLAAIDGEAASTNEQEQVQEPEVTASEEQDLDSIKIESVDVAESGKLDRQDMYLLADFISRPEEEYLKRLGLEVSPQDQQEIGIIAKNLKQAFEEEGVVVDLDTATEALIGKLKAFAKDTEGVFMENDENEDAQFLLATLASLDEEQIDAFSRHL